MFSLIITVISIALVAALALATLYYGGSAFGKGASRAEAAKIVLQGQQLLGAADLYFTEKRQWPTSINQLVTDGYLKQVPNAAASGLTEALAAGTPWTMPIPGAPMFVLATAVPEVCAEVNLSASLRQRAILAHAYQSLVAQCYGGTAATLQTVFRKSADTPLRDGTNGLPAADIRPGNPPTDPTDPDWFVAPGATPPGGGGGGGGGTGNGSNPVTQGALQVSYSSISFPDTVVGSRSLPNAPPVLTNTSGQPIYLNGFAAVDAVTFPVTLGDCASVLFAGQTCTLKLQFSPADPGGLGTRSTTAQLATSQGPVNFTLSGTGVARTAAVTDTPGTGGIAVSYTRVVFPDTPVGDYSYPDSMPVVTNNTAAPVTIGTFVAANEDHITTNAGSCAYWDFDGDGNWGPQPVVLAPGDSCELDMEFGPNALGTHSTAATLTTSGGPVSFMLTGRGIPRPPTDFSLEAAGEFTPTAVGSFPQSVGYVATMDVPSMFTFVSASVSEPSWSITSNGCTAGGWETCTLNIQWNPASFGQKTGVLSLTLMDDSGVAHTHTLPLNNYAIPPSNVAGTPFVGSQATDGNGNTIYGRTTGINFGAVDLSTTATHPQPTTMFALDSGRSVYGVRFETDSPAFGVTSDCPAEVPFGQQCQLQVTFTPEGAGAHTGHLKVYYFDGTGERLDATHIIDLAGHGGPLPAPAEPAVPLCTYPVQIRQHLSGGYNPSRLGIDQFMAPAGWYDFNGTPTYYPSGWAYELVDGGTEQRPCQ